MKLIGKLRMRIKAIGAPQSGAFHSEPSSWFLHQLHHLQVALAVASLVGLLHTFGHLDWLDAAMLRMVGAEVTANIAGVTPTASQTGMPEVLLIDEGMYDRDFRQRSPLDRDQLARLLRTAFASAATRPKTLVIDLDLSDTGHDPAQEKLHLVLREFIESGMNVVLPVPAGAGTLDGAQRQLKWIREVVCQWVRPDLPEAKGRAMLAGSLLRTHGGLVLQYSPREWSLGLAALHPKADQPECDPANRTSAQDLLSAPGRATLSVPPSVANHEPELRPFNAHFFGRLDQHVRVFGSVDAPWGDAAKGVPTLAGKVVFMGGAYDPRDRFETPLAVDGRPVEGVVLHAATYYSALSPVSNDKHYLAWVIDVAVGFAVGWAFSVMWRWYAQAGQRAGWVGYFGPKFLLLFNLFAAVALACLAVMWAAHWAYPRNLWISPGPVVLGVFVKLLLTRLHGTEPHAESQPHRPAFSNRTLARLVGGAGAGGGLPGDHSHSSLTCV